MSAHLREAWGALVGEANLDEIRQELKDHGPDEYGGWACFAIAPMIERKWGYPSVEGYYAPEGNVTKALDTGRLYTHWWNILPDGRILDATAGQWKRGQGNIEVLPGNDPRYVEWEDIPAERQDEALDMEQWAFFTGAKTGEILVPLRVGPGVFWRVHPKGRSFDVGGGSSKIHHKDPTGLPKALTQEVAGYSAFSNPWHLYLYVREMDWDTGPSIEVIGFEGKIVGSGWDGEPTVLPRSQPFDRMSWDDFEIRCEVTNTDPSPWYEGINMPVEAKTAVAGVTPEQLAFMNKVRAECQQTFGDAMVCREVTKALADEYGWTVESGYYHGPGHDIRPTYGAFPGHRYIRQPDGSILDVTHDQYEPGMPLLVIPPGDPRQEWYKKIGSKTAGMREDAVALGEEWIATLGTTPLVGMCGHATRVIADHVPGVKWAYGEYRIGENVAFHTWNVLPDGTIIDPTHEQYGGDRHVAVIPPGDPRYQRYKAVEIGQAPKKLPKTMWEVYGTPEERGKKRKATLKLKVGDEVRVSLGTRTVTGYIMEIHGDDALVDIPGGPKGRRVTKKLDELEPTGGEGLEIQGSTWRGFSGEGRTIWNEHDVVILSQRRGRERYFEVFIEGKNFRNFPRLDEAKAGVEAKLGRPIPWKQEKMDRVWVEHYYFGWTPEFTDPLFVYYADL